MKLAIAALVAAGAACGPGRPAATPPGAPLIDLSQSLEPFRAELDAHAGQARFIALLSPT